MFFDIFSTSLKEKEILDEIYYIILDNEFKIKKTSLSLMKELKYNIDSLLDKEFKVISNINYYPYNSDDDSKEISLLDIANKKINFKYDYKIINNEYLLLIFLKKDKDSKDDTGARSSKELDIYLKKNKDNKSLLAIVELDNFDRFEKVFDEMFANKVLVSFAKELKRVIHFHLYRKDNRFILLANIEKDWTKSNIEKLTSFLIKSLNKIQNKKIQIEDKTIYLKFKAGYVLTFNKNILEYSLKALKEAKNSEDDIVSFNINMIKDEENYLSIDKINNNLDKLDIGFTQIINKVTKQVLLYYVNLFFDKKEINSSNLIQLSKQQGFNEFYEVFLLLFLNKYTLKDYKFVLDIPSSAINSFHIRQLIYILFNNKQVVFRIIDINFNNNLKEFIINSKELNNFIAVNNFITNNNLLQELDNLYIDYIFFNKKIDKDVFDRLFIYCKQKQIKTIAKEDFYEKIDYLIKDTK